jgi:hypothetical protein
MSDLFVGDLGVVINADVGQDLDGATKMQFLVILPTDPVTTATWTAIEHPVTANTIQYTIPVPLIEGSYIINPYVEWGSLSKHRGDTFTFDVITEGA